jgi:hypothetical protein
MSEDNTNVNQNPEVTVTTHHDTVTFPVDPEPFSLRLSLIVLLIFTVVATYILAINLMNTGGINLLAFFGAIITGSLVLYVVEKPIKRYWPQTRFLIVSDDSIRIERNGKLDRELDPRQQINVFSWYFTVDRRSRVPKGWHVIGFALEQDDLYLAIYTIMSPEDFQTISRDFQKLQSKKSMGSGKDLRLAGQQRRLHMAEAARSLEGAEVSNENFEAYLNTLEDRFTRWMPRRTE